MSFGKILFKCHLESLKINNTNVNGILFKKKQKQKKISNQWSLNGERIEIIVTKENNNRKVWRFQFGKLDDYCQGHVRQAINWIVLNEVKEKGGSKYRIIGIRWCCALRHWTFQAYSYKFVFVVVPPHLTCQPAPTPPSLISIEMQIFQICSSDIFFNINCSFGVKLNQ